MRSKLRCFKAYDVRGILDESINADICYRIGRAFVTAIKAKKIVVGFDARSSSDELARAVRKGIRDQGSDVINIGLCGTEEVYWATTEFGSSGGIQVTASHNPINYNGLKFVKGSSKPLDPKTDLLRIKNIAENNSFFGPAKKGVEIEAKQEARNAYIKKLLSFVSFRNIRPLRILINSGNGAAGPTFDALATELSKTTKMLRFNRLYHHPDGSFPNGIPNPLLTENQTPMSKKVLSLRADFGVAFDGDFDRCFFFDDHGSFVPGEYIVGLLASAFLEKEQGARIVHDTRVIWNTIDAVTKGGGVAIPCKTGHSFMKQEMRKHNAIYGGEMSAHHYFRDFAFCDSGMIPMLLVTELIGRTGKSLSKLIEERRKKFPSSGEINFQVSDVNIIIKRLEEYFDIECLDKDSLDGVSYTFNNWRFNLRKSNTEPLVRLNVESKKDKRIVNEKLDLIKKLIT